MKTGFLALSLILALGQAARADFGSCKQQIKAQAAASGVSQATLARALDGLEPNDAVSFLGVQPEFTTPIWDYIAGLVDDERVRDGQARFSEYRQAALDGAAALTASTRRRSSRSGASSPTSARALAGARSSSRSRRLPAHPTDAPIIFAAN